MGFAYRPDVDGLRALAVLAVIAFHAAMPGAKGGFIGVDIFFVISGFLIGSMIEADLATGSFSYRNFFARRARRILPALFLVTALTILAGWWILLPAEYQRLGQSVAYTAGLIPNVFFAQQAGGYFAPTAELDPLLHLWSLGVEAQFYLGIPVILVTAARRGLPVRIVIIVISVVSMMISIMTAGTEHGFYWPWGRAWEFLAGAAVSRITSQQHDANGRLLPAAGILALAVSLLVIGPDTPYPGMWAALPCLGAACLIGAGPGNRITSALLGNPAMAYLGRISYGLYLWHYPILVFQRLVLPSPTAMEIAGALLVATILAIVTHTLVDIPVRRCATGNPHAFARPMALAAAALALVGALLVITAGAPSRIAAIAPEPFDHEAALRFRTCLIDATQGAADYRADLCLNTASSVTLWGDSHAAHLWPGFAGTEDAKPSQLTAAGCFPEGKSRAGRCADAEFLFMQHLQRMKPHTVVLAAHWQTYNAATLTAHLEETMNWLRGIGVVRIMVVGPVPTWPYAVPDHAVREAMIHRLNQVATTAILPEIIRRQLDALDRRLERTTKERGGEYVSPMRMFCSDAACKIAANSTAPVRFLYFDGNHLAIEGAREIVWRMNTGAGQRPPFPPTDHASR